MSSSSARSVWNESYTLYISIQLLGAYVVYNFIYFYPVYFPLVSTYSNIFGVCFSSCFSPPYYKPPKTVYSFKICFKLQYHVDLMVCQSLHLHWGLKIGGRTDSHISHTSYQRSWGLLIHIEIWPIVLSTWFTVSTYVDDSAFSLILNQKTWSFRWG